MWKSPSDFCVCDVSVVVGVDAELKEYTVIRDVAECEETIVSQSRAILSTSSQDQTEQGLGDFNEILSPLGSETQLVVLSRANGIALFFTCMTLSAVMSLRHLWRTTELVKYETITELKEIVKKLFTFLAGAAGYTWPWGDTCNVGVRRLTWPLAQYERCLEFFRFSQGTQAI